MNNLTKRWWKPSPSYKPEERYTESLSPCTQDKNPFEPPSSESLFAMAKIQWMIMKTIREHD